MHWQLWKLFPCSTTTARLTSSVKGMIQHSAKVPMDFLPLGQLPCSVAFITTPCNSLFILKMSVWTSKLLPRTLDQIYRVKKTLSIPNESKLSEVEADWDHPFKALGFFFGKDKPEWITILPSCTAQLTAAVQQLVGEQFRCLCWRAKALEYGRR